jgi:four helix bundle protein
VSLDYKDLVAYQQAVALGDYLHAAVARWPRDQRWTVGEQMLRSVDSVGANIAEGAGRWKPNDKLHFFVIARGSLNETEHWIMRARKLGLLDQNAVQRVRDAARPLNGLIKKQRER